MTVAGVTVILPVKPFDEAKSRLAPALSDRQRRALSRDFFRHVLGIVGTATGVARCIIVSRSNEALDLARRADALPVVETGDGLNSALRQAVAVAARIANDPVLMLSTDLPLLTADDVAAMVEDRAIIGIAPDRAGSGTNALFMASPALIDPCFGERSCAAHRNAAMAAGLSATSIRRAGLATDIDTPADLALLADVTQRQAG